MSVNNHSVSESSNIFFQSKKVLTGKAKFAGHFLAVATLTATVLSIVVISTGCFGNIGLAFGAASAGFAFLSFGAREIVVAVNEKDEEKEEVKTTDAVCKELLCFLKANELDTLNKQSTEYLNSFPKNDKTTFIKKPTKSDLGFESKKMTIALNKQDKESEKNKTPSRTETAVSYNIPDSGSDVFYTEAKKLSDEKMYEDLAKALNDMKADSFSQDDFFEKA